MAKKNKTCSWTWAKLPCGAFCMFTRGFHHRQSLPYYLTPTSLHQPTARGYDMFIYTSKLLQHIYIYTLYITYIYNIEVPHQILPAILSNRCLRVLPPLPHHVLWKPMPSAPPVITMFKKVGWLLTIPRKMGGKYDIVLTTWYIQIPLKSSFLLIRYH